MSRRDGLGTARGAKQRCITVRDLLHKSPELCTAEELADYWPGGAENKLAGLAGWVYCYANLMRFWGRAERLASDEQNAALTVERAIAGLPEAVSLTGTDEFGVHLTVSVYPKSFYALLHTMERDIALTHLAHQYRQLETRGTPTAGELMGRCLVEMGYQQRVLTWLVCHPTAGMPWSDAETRPTPPEWTAALSPLDLVSIIQAHRRVNGTQLQIVAAILGMPGSGSDEPVSWITIVTAAQRRFGQSHRALMRDEPLVSLTAQLLVSQNEEAKAHAAQERQRSVNASALPPMVG